MDISKINQYKSGGRIQTPVNRDDRCVLVIGDNVVRIVDDFEWAWRSWIKCDDGEMHSFNLKEDGLLFKLITTVMAYDLVDDPQKPGKKKRQYRLSSSNPILFQMVSNNESENDSDSGWYPVRIYMMNCLERNSRWCELNKHTKLLVKTKSEIGIGQKAFDAFANVAEEYGDPTQYDINFTKKGGSQYNTEYGCVRANLVKHTCAKEGPLTPEEMSYQRHDLKSLATPSPSEYVLRLLTEKIKLVDQQLGTNFLQRFSEDAAAHPSQATATVAKPSVTMIPNVGNTPVKVAAPVNQFVTPAAPQAAPVAHTFKVATPPTVLAPVPANEQLSECPGVNKDGSLCKKMIPISSKFCPHCGTKFVID